MGCPMETIRRETGAYCAEPMDIVVTKKAKAPAKPKADVKEDAAKGAAKEAKVRGDFKKLLAGGYATIPLGHLSEE